ncbi:hypothetical protein AB0D13_40635 [Streptomyces sp. NPDC048430]|uniref:hypothetical protein n=1 Tax=Streptomyces sp. NPDC048430 TaxID=3155388 RepID=UPI003423EF93
MRITVDDFTAAEQAARDQARGLARTIADTLTAMYPDAAYLVMHHDEDEVLWLHGIRDTVVVCDFEEAALAAPVADSELRRAWGDLDPQQPRHLLHLVRRLEDVGGCFDILPDTAYHDSDNGEDGLLCLLLSEQAVPELWDWGGDELLRPYSAPRPDNA